MMKVMIKKLIFIELKNGIMLMALQAYHTNVCCNVEIRKEIRNELVGPESSQSVVLRIGYV